MASPQKQSFIKPSDLIKSQLQEGVKSHFVYDGLNRMQLSYTSAWNAENGDACLVTEYQYDSTSNRVLNMKEYLGSWNSSWDF